MANTVNTLYCWCEGGDATNDTFGDPQGMDPQELRRMIEARQREIADLAKSERMERLRLELGI